MESIDELIKYNQEGEFLEFKLVEYRDEIRANLIKDVMALANAFHQGDRYLIIGLKKEGDDIRFNPIEKREDDAGIQQFIHQNIFPELSISYTLYKYEGNALALLTIKNPTDQPYSAIKSLNNKSGVVIRQNEMYIKKGSHQLLMSRRDLDRIYQQKYKANGLEGKIELVFENGKKEIEIECVRNIQKPSQLEKRKIENEINSQEDLLNRSPREYLEKVSQRTRSSQSYDQMDLPELKRQLASIERTYETEDRHYLYETRAYKLNLTVLNHGDKYLESVLLILSIADIEGLKVINYIAPMLHQVVIPANRPTYNYPKVEYQNGQTIVTQELKEVRHHFPTTCFETALRVFAGEALGKKMVRVKAKIIAANLNTPQEYELIVNFK